MGYQLYPYLPGVLPPGCTAHPSGMLCYTPDVVVTPNATPPYTPPDPLNVDNSTPPVVSEALAVSPSGKNCGCCGVVGGGSVGTPGSIASPVVNNATPSAAKCGDCGYTNRETLLAVAVATVAFLLIRK